MRFFGLLIVVLIIAVMVNSKDETAGVSRAAPTPEEIAAKARQEAAFQRVVVVLKSIKAANRNPDSVKWEGIWANGDASVVCIDYRGQNGFGGMNREQVVYAKNKLSREASAWNRHCTKGDLQDMIYARQAL